MKFLRSIGGYTKLDTERNSQVREELKVEEVNGIIIKYRESWKQRISRMGSDRFPKVALLDQPKWKRSLGRPKKRWSDQFGAGTD